VHLLYSFCFTLGFLLALPYFLAEALLRRKYLPSFWQRLGYLPSEIHSSLQQGIWIHAVSVGEVLAILPLAQAIRKKWPERPLFVSTTTLTGQSLAKLRLSGKAKIFYFPFDWRFSVSKSLDRICPGLVLIAETEIWPNFLRECHHRGIPVMLINGRISQRSIRWYSKVDWFMKDTFAYFSNLCMQSQNDLERILSLGAPRQKAMVCGNLKYDLGTPDGMEQKVTYYRRLLSIVETSFLVVAGSTMKDEEEPVLSAFRILKSHCPQAVLLLAPRHPERFDEVEQILAEQSFHYVRRSTLSLNGQPSLTHPVEAVLLDSMGELAVLYALADVVFIGGSLVPKGGHNILEPALFQKPVLFGPHMGNFKEMAEHFVQRNAALMVDNENALAAKLVELQHDGALRRQMGENGYQVLMANRGTTERIIRRMEILLTGTEPN
jgi:3-deoxy-D-manno-octulosonic-acid transferase